MKQYFIKMAVAILIITSFANIYMEKKESHVNIVNNNIIYKNSIPVNVYETQIVYENMTLKELSTKIDKNLGTLNGYGNKIATLSLENNVDPIIATSIILLETGCIWNCSSAVTYNHNVGGMYGNGGLLKFNSLDEGIEAFIKNLANNYYKIGLNTPELINKKYATNPNWYLDVYYYVNLIKAS